MKRREKCLVQQANPTENDQFWVSLAVHQLLLEVELQEEELEHTAKDHVEMEGENRQLEVKAEMKVLEKNEEFREMEMAMHFSHLRR